MWMIYGANGYTGRLTAREAKRRGLTPVLAGRRREAVEALAKELDLESRVFDLADPAAVTSNLEGTELVLHCAGPFSATARPMLDACVRTGTHYLDITGEIDVFEHVHQNDARWTEAGIVAMPGVGFDVVPSDCLAAMLARELPDATHLALAFRSAGASSKGTTKTMVEGLPHGGRIRRNGSIVRTPPGDDVRPIPFTAERSFTAAAIPWGDVSTAYYSTGIPNIVVYCGVPASAIRGMKAMRVLGPVVGLAPVQCFLKEQVQKRVPDPEEDPAKMGDTLLWGEVRDAAGTRVAKRMRTPGGYGFTVSSSLLVVEKVLGSTVDTVPRGARTPSMAFGPDLVLEIEGVTCEAA